MSSAAPATDTMSRAKTPKAAKPTRPASQKPSDEPTMPTSTLAITPICASVFMNLLASQPTMPPMSSESMNPMTISLQCQTSGGVGPGPEPRQLELTLATKRSVLNTPPFSLPLISYVILSTGSPSSRPTTCRTMRSTETVTGTATIVSPNAGTVPPSLVTPLANVLSSTSSFTYAPENSIGDAFGFCTRSFTSMWISAPSPSSAATPGRPL